MWYPQPLVFRQHHKQLYFQLKFNSKTSSMKILYIPHTIHTYTKPFIHLTVYVHIEYIFPVYISRQWKYNIFFPSSRYEYGRSARYLISNYSVTANSQALGWLFVEPMRQRTAAISFHHTQPDPLSCTRTHAYRMEASKRGFSVELNYRPRPQISRYRYTEIGNFQFFVMHTLTTKYGYEENIKQY